jgi:hypothetical protein
MAKSQNISPTAASDYLKSLGALNSTPKSTTGTNPFLSKDATTYSAVKDQDASGQDFLSWLGDIVSRPLFAVTETASSIADAFDKEQALNPLDAVGRVVSAPFRGFFSTDPADKIYTGDLIEKVTDISGRNTNPNYKDVQDNANPVLKGLAGFVGDVALDPTTYIGLGLYKQLGQKIAGGAAKAIEAAPVIGNAIKATKTAAEAVFPAANAAGDIVDAAVPGKVIADGNVAVAADEVVYEATGAMPGKVSNYLGKTLSQIVSRQPVKGGKAAAIENMQAFTSESKLLLDEVTAGGIVHINPVSKIEDYLDSVIEAGKNAPGFTARIKANGVDVTIDLAKEAAKAKRFLAGKGGQVFKDIAQLVSKYDAQLADLSTKMDALGAEAQSPALNARFNAMQDKFTEVETARRKAIEQGEILREGAPQLSQVAEVFRRYQEAFGQRGITGVTLAGDGVVAGANGVLDGLNAFRIASSLNRDYVDALFGADLSNRLRLLKGPKFDATLSAITSLLTKGGIDETSALARGEVFANDNGIVRDQIRFLEHIGVDYKSFQDMKAAINVQMSISNLTPETTIAGSVDAWLKATQNLAQIARKYEVADNTEADFIFRVVNDSVPEVTAKNMNGKTIGKTHEYRTSNKDVYRTADQMGEGVGVDIRNANTFFQGDSYVAVTTKVNQHVKEMGLTGFRAGRTRYRLSKAALRLMEDYYASIGINVHLDLNGIRHALTISKIADTLIPLEARAAGTARQDEKLLTMVLFSPEGSVVSSTGKTTPTGVKPTIVMDAVSVALQTNDPELVRAALMSTERRVPSADKVANWLSDPNAEGVFGFYPTKQLQIDPKTKKIVLPEEAMGAFPIPNDKGAFVGYKAKTIVDSMTDLIMSKREELLALADASEKAIAVSRKAKIFAISDRVLKLAVEHENNPMLRAQSLIELANPATMVADASAKAGADSVVNVAANVIVDAAIGDATQTIAKSAVSKGKGQQKVVSAKTAKEKAAAQKEVQAAGEARSELSAQTAEQNLKDMQEIRAELPDEIKPLLDDLTTAGPVQRTADEAYANVMGYIMSAPFLQKFRKLFDASYGLVSDKLNLFMLTRNMMALSRIIRGDRTKTYRELAKKYGEMLPDGKTTVLVQAFRNIQNGGSSPDPQITAAMGELQVLLAELFDFQNKTETAVLGSAFFQESQGVEYLNSLLKQYDILRPNGKELSKEAKAFLDSGREYFDISQAIAERTLMGTKGKDIDLLSSAAGQWKSWPIDDPVDFLSKADVVVLHAATDTGVMESAKRMGLAAGWASNTGEKGFVALDGTGRFTQLFPKDMTFDPEVAEMLNKLDAMSQGSSEINKFFTNVYDPIQRAWQFGITQLRPGHHVRNAVGDESITYLAEGIKYQMRSAKDAFKIMSVYGSYENTDFLRMMNQMGDVIIPKAGDVLSDGRYGKISTDTLAEAISRFGLPTAKIIDDIFDTGSDVSKIAKVAKKVSLQDTKAADFAGNVSEARDHWSRMKHFMQIIHKEQNRGAKRFKTQDELFKYAAERVQKFHPDSTTLSKFEQKYMRRLVPFYGWTRGAIPALVEVAFTAPGRVTALNKASYNLAIMMGVNPDSMYDPFPEDQLFPSFLTDKVQGPQFKIGENYYSVSPGFISWDLPNTFMSDPLRGTIGSTSPLIRIPVELLTGTSLGTGAKIRDTSDYVDSAIPGVNYLASISGYSPTGSIASMLQGMGLDPMYQVASGNRTGTSAGISAFNFLTGAGLAEYSRPNYVNYAEIEKRNREAVNTRSGY